MRIHRNLAEGVTQICDAILKNGEVAARALDKAFETNKKWGKRDRAFIAENVYEIVRWKRFLGIAAGKGDAWSLLGAQIVRSGGELPEWSEFSHLDAERLRANFARPDSDFSRAERQSIPLWLDELGESELGAAWDAELEALNQSAPVVIRANTLQISRDELRNQLNEAAIETQTVPELPDALQLQNRVSLARFVNAGSCEIQDGASQMVAPFLEVQKGQKIVDACAGAGGKSLHIAALVQNKAQILALDIAGEKLAELRKRAARGGAKILAQKAMPEFLKTLENSADRVLIDAPCSGLGTLRRQSDIKWRLNAKTLEKTRGLQRELLRENAKIVKSGGKLVYATCSILHSENAEQIAWFLSENPDFELEETREISVAQTGFDGFFMARLRRK